MNSEAGESRLSTANKAMSTIFVSLLIATAVLVIVSFPIGLYTVFFTSLSTQLNASSVVTGIFVFIGPLVTSIPIPGSMGGFFVVLSAIYAGMFALAASQGKGLASSLKGAFTDGFGSLFSNVFFVTLVAIGFLGFTILLIDSLEASSGVPVGGLSGDAMQLLMSLTIAPLREEFGFRVLIIGSVSLLLCVGKPGSKALRALWRPSVVLEGEVNTSLSMAILGAATVISSVIFGLVHVSSGAGWQVGKLPEAAFAGIVLSYLYVKYGFHVAVLAHWGIDYLDSIYAFFGQGVYGIPWTSDNGYILQQLVAFDTVALLGVASFLGVCYLGLKSLAVRRSPPSEL